ncbi:MAG: LysM peptidoglycan-binding domain-containing protein, partial [Caldilineaceae bacterium]|nr:LysM peptidoglycan-binding domain-containing protein [Caldilineaceae bacterium]
DIYGNRSVLAAPPANLALPTRYVDSLVGVNQWPGFNEHYRFQRKDDTTVTLHVDLGLAVAHFVPAADVPPDEIQRRVDAGVEAYRTVVHQLSRADVTITLRTSLMVDAHTLPRAEIAQCTAEIYAFLRTLQAARPHRHTPNRASLVLVAAAFHVGVGDLAAANQRTPDLFGVGATLTIPTADPGEYTTQPGDTLAAVAANVGLSVAALAAANQNVPLAAAVDIPAQMALGSVQDATAATLPDGLDAALANRHLRGLLRAGVRFEFGGNDHVISANETLASLASLVGIERNALTELISALPPTAWTDDARFLAPPSALALTVDLARDPAQYPADLIFPVGVQIDIDRDPALVSADVNDVPEIQHITSYLSPAVAREDGAPITLRDFAAAFEDGFPGLKLAVGRQDAAAEKALWAVHLGNRGHGIDYAFDAGSAAQFFAPAPLSTQPVSGEVRLDRYAEDGLHDDGPTQRFASAALDAWARNFLAAVDRFLDPDVVTPAYAVAADSVRAVLGHKRALATAIAARVEPVFVDVSAPAESSVRRDAAAETLRQQLLQALEAAYTIETVVQLGVDVTLPEGAAWASAVAPRLAGKPVTVGDADAEATLSACKLSLAPGRSFLSFLYNTADPGAARSRTLDLAFRVTDLEKDIAPLSGFDGYERSSWLSFVLPLAADQAHHIGAVTIPIPLRAYPLPPSLIRHQGEADPDSVTTLDAVRRWQYRYVYEHLDVAQDVINTDITFNAVSQIAPPATSAGTGPRSLFEALANFVTLYPAIAADLDALTADGGDPTNAVVAIAAFAQLVGEVSAALSPRGGRSLGRGVVESVRYAISERRDEDDTLHVTITTVNDGLTPPPAGTRTPQIEIAGYTQSGPPVVDGDETRYILVPEAGTAPQEANTVTGLGNSSLPDRALIVPDLDVIQQQLATASIWLTRNRELVDGRVTNPSFVYKTPLIRFRNSTSPLVQNRTPWDIAAIGSPTGAAQRRPLAAHVDALFAALLPAVAQNDYAIR